MSATPPASGLNPLWIVSLFLGVAEVTAGVAATTSDGATQTLFAVFATGFPVGVAAAFFTILWKRPHVLYAPRDYPEGMAPREFVEAITPRRVEALEGAVRKSIENTVPAEAADRVVEQAREEFLDSTVHVVVDPAIGSAMEEFWVVVNDGASVREFLDRIYFALAPAVPPNTYGAAWLVLNETTGQAFTDVTSLWGTDEGRSRSLSDIGIVPGHELRVVRP